MHYSRVWYTGTYNTSGGAGRWAPDDVSTIDVVVKSSFAEIPDGASSRDFMIEKIGSTEWMQVSATRSGSSLIVDGIFDSTAGYGKPITLVHGDTMEVFISMNAVDVNRDRQGGMVGLIVGGDSNSTNPTGGGYLATDPDDPDSDLDDIYVMDANGYTVPVLLSSVISATAPLYHQDSKQYYATGSPDSIGFGITLAKRLRAIRGRKTPICILPVGWWGSSVTDTAYTPDSETWSYDTDDLPIVEIKARVKRFMDADPNNTIGYWVHAIGSNEPRQYPPNTYGSSTEMRDTTIYTLDSLKQAFQTNASQDTESMRRIPTALITMPDAYIAWAAFLGNGDASLMEADMRDVVDNTPWVSHIDATGLGSVGLGWDTIHYNTAAMRELGERAAPALLEAELRGNPINDLRDATARALSTTTFGIDTTDVTRPLSRSIQSNDVGIDTIDVTRPVSRSLQDTDVGIDLTNVARGVLRDITDVDVGVDTIDVTRVPSRVLVETEVGVDTSDITRVQFRTLADTDVGVDTSDVTREFPDAIDGLAGATVVHRYNSGDVFVNGSGYIEWPNAAGGASALSRLVETAGEVVVADESGQNGVRFYNNYNYALDTAALNIDSQFAWMIRFVTTPSSFDNGLASIDSTNELMTTYNGGGQRGSTGIRDTSPVFIEAYAANTANQTWTTKEYLMVGVQDRASATSSANSISTRMYVRDYDPDSYADFVEFGTQVTTTNVAQRTAAANFVSIGKREDGPYNTSLYGRIYDFILWNGLPSDADLNDIALDTAGEGLWDVAIPYDDFTGSGALDTAKWDTLNPTETGITVSQTSNKYNAAIDHDDAADDNTTWYGDLAGRFDYVEFASGDDFDFIARNAGIDSGSDEAGEVQLSGIMVRDPDNDNEWENAVAGNRDPNHNTIEIKTTAYSGGLSSEVSHTGTNSIWTYKADLRVKRVSGTVSFWYKDPTDGIALWTELDHDGLSGPRITLSGDVQVGLITYGYAYPTSFVGTIDQVEIPKGTPIVT